MAVLSRSTVYNILYIDIKINGVMKKTIDINYRTFYR